MICFPEDIFNFYAVEFSLSLFYCPGIDLEEIKTRLTEAKLLLKKSKRVNLYKVLGVAKGRHATEAEIRTAYKRAALEWHPDRRPTSNKIEAESKFIEIGNDFTALSSHGCTLLSTTPIN